MNEKDLQRDELLQRFLDGDLSPQEAREARALMATDPEFSAGAERYRRLGDLMRELARSEAFEKDTDAIWARIEGGLASGRNDDIAPSGHARVWVSEVVAHRKRYWIPALGASVAGAVAAIVMAMYVPVDSVPITMPQAAELRSRVTDISLNSASTLVFEVETGSGGTAAILWVTADEDEQGPDALEAEDRTIEEP